MKSLEDLDSTRAAILTKANDIFDRSADDVIHPLVKDIYYHACDLSDCTQAAIDEAYSIAFKNGDLQETITEYEYILSDLLTIVTTDMPRRNEMHIWCLDNLKSDYYYLDQHRVGFVSIDEALQFKLTWGGRKDNV